MEVETPLFFMNEEWYYYDEELEKYVLTDKAPIDAVKSYYEYYSNEESEEN